MTTVAGTGTAGTAGIRVLLAATTALVAACADRPAGPPSSAGGQRYSGTTTVLESAEHGPQLCLGGVAESLPPQCGGPDVVGWDWGAVDGEETAAGTTWGEYRVTGTWDGGQLTLSEPPAVAEPAGAPPSGDAFATPCEPPAGGWAAVDPSTATQEDMDAAIEYARAQPFHAGVWLDQLAPPEEPVREEPFQPDDVVLNMRATEDLERLEREIRARWGGPLCITRAERTLDELSAVQQELQREVDGILGSSVDEMRGVVDITVPVVDDELRDRLDERYPGDVVEVHGTLEPLP